MRTKLDSTCMVMASLLVMLRILVVGTGFLVTAHSPKSNLCVLKRMLGFFTLASSLMLNRGPLMISSSTSERENAVSLGYSTTCTSLVEPASTVALSGTICTVSSSNWFFLEKLKSKLNCPLFWMVSVLIFFMRTYTSP